MAILEVHDGRGHVRRVAISPEEPALIGSSPACAIVVEGAGVAPVHGRIRWSKRRYKVDAGEGVDAIEVNGKRLRSSSIYQGDEIRIGLARIFVIATEGKGKTPADDKTVIRPAPSALSEPPSSARARPGASFESPAVAKLLEPPKPAEPLKRRRDWQKTLAGAEPSVELPPPRPQGGWSRLKARFGLMADAPGQERVISSPIVIGLGATLFVIVALSVSLWKIIAKTTAERQYNQAFEALDSGDYRNALRQLDDFLAGNPKDARSNKARVFRALANVRQYTTSSAASWDNAVKAARQMVDEVGNLPEYHDASTELAEQLVKSVEGLADRARANADPSVFGAAEAALAFQRQVAGKAADALLNRSRALPKLDEAREAIRRNQIRTKSLAAIDAALDAGSAAKAFEERDALVGVYADMAADRELVARLVKATDLIRQAVKFDPSGRPGETEPHADALGPPTTLVLRLEPGRKPTGGPPIFAIADGLAFGLDGATGAPIWQAPVGLASPFPPVILAGADASILLVDARHDELVRVDGKSGRLIWRQELGERVDSPPLVLGNEVYQATPSGKILLIDLASGALRGALDLGRRLAKSPVVDESGEHLFVLGDEECLFLLDRSPLACRAVEYLGHAPGSVACTPRREGRFLVTVENTTLGDGRWRIYVLDESGGNPKLRQTIPVAGWTWETPSAHGSILWSASDRGEVRAYSIGLYEAEQPLKPIATIAAESETSGPAFGLARSEREFLLAGGRPSRIDLNADAARLAGAWSLGAIGAALAPVQPDGRLVVFTQESNDGPGVALWGVDPENGAIRWRTTLGAPWPIAPTPGKDGSLTTLGFDGSDLVLGKDQLAKGGFVEQPLPKPGVFRVPSGAAARLDCNGVAVLVPSLTGSQLLVRRDGGKYQPIDLPAPLGAAPIAWAGGVLVPGSDGRAYLIDPETGEAAADPFVPKFDRDHPSHWLAPVPVEGGAVILADREGRIRRLTRAESPSPRLAVTGESPLGQGLAVGPASTGGAVIVATADGKVRSLSARDLSPVATVDLPAPRAFGPVTVGDHAFVADASGDVFVFGPDGRKAWQARLQSTANDPPAVREGTAWFLTRTGSIEARSLADGAKSERFSIGALPAGAAAVAGGRIYVPSGLGSIRAVADERIGSGKGGE